MNLRTILSCVAIIMAKTFTVSSIAVADDRGLIPAPAGERVFLAPGDENHPIIECIIYGSGTIRIVKSREMPTVGNRGSETNLVSVGVYESIATQQASNELRRFCQPGDLIILIPGDAKRLNTEHQLRVRAYEEKILRDKREAEDLNRKRDLVTRMLSTPVIKNGEPIRLSFYDTRLPIANPIGKWCKVARDGLLRIVRSAEKYHLVTYTGSVNDSTCPNGTTLLVTDKEWRAIRGDVEHAIQHNYENVRIEEQRKVYRRALQELLNEARTLIR